MDRQEIKNHLISVSYKGEHKFRGLLILIKIHSRPLACPTVAIDISPAGQVVFSGAVQFSNRSDNRVGF